MVGKLNHGAFVVLVIELLKGERNISFLTFVWLFVRDGIPLPGS